MAWLANGPLFDFLLSRYDQSGPWPSQYDGVLFIDLANSLMPVAIVLTLMTAFTFPDLICAPLDADLAVAASRKGIG